MTRRIAAGVSPQGAKDDPSDADLAVDILLKHRDELRPWVPDDPRTRQLQALVQARRRLVEQRVRATNRLLANLKGYYPQAVECFDSLDSVLACDFLTQWPSLGEAKRARAATLTTFFHRHGGRSQERIAARITLLKGALPLTTDSGVIVPSLLATRTLVAELRALIEGIDSYDATIARLFKAHPDAFIFASLPGPGRPSPRACWRRWAVTAHALRRWVPCSNISGSPR